MGRSLGYMVVPFLGVCDRLEGFGRASNAQVPFFDTFVTA